MSSQIDLYNSIGNLVASYEGHGEEYKISLKNFHSGIYLAAIKSNGNNIGVYKFLITN